MRKHVLGSWLAAIGATAPLLFGAEKAAPVVEVGPAIFHAPAARRAPAQSGDVLWTAPLPEAARHALGPLTAAERAELQAPDRRRDGARSKAPAVKIGISRPLSGVGFTGLSLSLAPGQSAAFGGGQLSRNAAGAWIWTAAFSSTDAGGLRLHLRRALLPPGSRVFVYSSDGEIQGPYGFDGGTRPEGFWTNTIFGDQMSLQVQFAAAPAAALEKATLVVDAVVHLEHPGFAPTAADKAGARPKSDTCFIDRSCVTTAEFPNVDLATRSIGQLTFVDEGESYVCTGGLLNSTTGSGIPYLLTANHCFSSQDSATSLEAFWQYRTATCNGIYPNENLFPRTLGSTLLATGSRTDSSDFTFVQLSQDPPDDSVLLGWTTADLTNANGLALYRLSYAYGNPMIYTKEQIDTSPPALCGDSPRNRFLYEHDSAGATGGGSSGSPVYLADLRVVGQEFGSCGDTSDDNCDVDNNATLDGQFRVTYPFVQQWLSPGGTAACVAGPTTLCLNGGRFRVTAYYATSGGASGPGMGVKLTNDSGYFWFFDAANIELIVKVLDACALPSAHFWVFAGGLTNVGVTLLVEDTETGATQTYSNPIGTAFAPLQDTLAFSCP